MVKKKDKKEKETKKEEESEKLAVRETALMWPWNIFRGFDEEFDGLRRDIQRSLLWPRSRIGSTLIPWPDYFWSNTGLSETRMALLDIKDTGDELVIEAEMPGIPKENIDIQLTENSIEICGEMQSQEKDEKKGYIRQERSYSTCVRHMPLPSEIIPDKADAILEDGILRIKLPKKNPTTKEKVRTLKVK